MARKSIKRANQNGLLSYQAKTEKPVRAKAPLVHWPDYRFEDAHLPPPGPGYRYVPSEEPLFEYAPDFEDIRQKEIGDCYLLSAINALLRLKPDHFFYDMIRATRNRVHVRFFGVDAAGKAASVIVSVERTMLKRIDGKKDVDLQGHGAVWPYFVEKAYAFFRLYYVQPLLDRNLIAVANPAAPLPAPPPWPFVNATCPPLKDPRTRYAVHYLEALEGGNAGEAYTHLTGEAIDDITQAQAVPGPHGYVWTYPREYRSDMLCCMLDETRPNVFGNPFTLRLRRFLAVMGKDLDYFTVALPGLPLPVDAKDKLRNALETHIAATRAGNRRVVGDLIAMLDKKRRLMREPRTADIHPYLARLKRSIVNLKSDDMKDVDFGVLIDRFVRLSFPGKRGTGEYADYHDEIFKRISAACAGGKGDKAAFASTRDIARIDDYWLFSSAVTGKRKGFVSGHAYEIAGTSRITITRSAKPVDIKFVLLRKPWRDYVRRYVFKANDPSPLNMTGSLSASPVDRVDDLPENALKILDLQAQGLRDEAKQLQAASSQQVRNSAAFPVELSDITKFFDQVQVGV